MQDNFAYLLPFIMLTFGVVFLFLQRIGHASARYWGIGYLSAAFGFATPLVLGGLPFEIQAIVSNLLFFSAFFLYGHALLTHFGRPLYVRARLSIVIAAVLLVSFHVFVTPDLKRELVIGDLICALLLAIPVWVVRKRPVALADRLMVGIACLVVMETLVRIGMLLVMTPNGSMVELSEFFESDYAFYMQLAASIFGFLLALSVLASQISVTVDRHLHAAEHDPLTDVLNRRGFDRRVPDFRNDTPDGAIITCDIDHFKRINDVYGHAAGDIVLIGLSDLLRRHAPENALVARFGGEEFVVFLPGQTAAVASQLANGMRTGLSSLDWRNRGVTSQITASFGVSAVARGDHSIHDAIKRADDSLYVAKRGGRDQVVLEGIRLSAEGPVLRVITKV
ncbi:MULTISPECIES: GGDEF domain-containing protein [unclassified Agrobacterium]|nr:MULTISPECIES: GGDEF domain-containing protein [unclassified Agrobacterium]MDH0614692.1 GGDEF domain-containing protein [Agrobacterium sp. GD03872]MDH0697065.1 GGDEF domain-containing protein [Agrobacterium sp. GD03871]MDH1059545.1 GGDEF domain-containing protein [Agrobacterium sp. GD03992]MDH2212252.1 GGDEF domain-containing protein [Agrobacterium sp. GD03643]MDH2219972.1 GGDEF domain-containing protein [Agrobacterium sp. GD03638]